MRTFETGATRDTDQHKYDYEGFFSPLVLERRAEYMDKHRKQADGKLRDSDNWQKGIPLSAYMKSAFRHFMEWWKAHRRNDKATVEEAIVALMFNCEGYLHELLKAKKKHAELSNSSVVDRVIPALRAAVPAYSQATFNWGLQQVGAVVDPIPASEQSSDRPVGPLSTPSVHLCD